MKGLCEVGFVMEREEVMRRFEMTGTSYDSIFIEYMDYYGDMSDQVVSWEPNGRFEILVHYASGAKAFYDRISRVVYNVQKRKCDSEFVEPHVYMTRFTWKLTAAVNASGLSRDEISKRTGISKAALSNYLTGSKMPSCHNVYKLAKVLKCSVADLLNVGDWDL